MILSWTDEAWEDYLYWQSTDKKYLKELMYLSKISNDLHLMVLVNLNPLSMTYQDIAQDVLIRKIASFTRLHPIQLS